MPSLPLRGEQITLAQALKVAGLAQSGGQAKQVVRSGAVVVNGVVETQPGRKLHSAFECSPLGYAARDRAIVVVIDLELTSIS